MSLHLPFSAPISNNRKRTRGRKIQIIQIPKTVLRKVKGELKEFPNPRYKKKKSVRIIHNPSSY